MWEAVARFFKKNPETPDPTQPLRVAAATLLVEAMRADRVVRPVERETVQRDLAAWFDLDPEMVGELLAIAEARSDVEHSLYPLTRAINEHFSTEERIEVIERMWRVAFADHQLKPEEEAVIRQAANMMHVAHSDFISAKLRARDAVMP